MALLAQLPGPIGPINLRLVLSDLNLSDILHGLVVAKGNRSGVPRVLAVDHNDTRELAGVLHIEGTSKDDAIAQIRAINTLATVGTTLTLQSTGATNAVTLKVLPSRGVSHPLDELFEVPGAPVLASCPFSFTCEPYAYGPQTYALQGATFTAPCVLDLGEILGDFRTPITMGGRIVGTFAHCLHVGLLAPGSELTIADLLLELEGGDWTGGNSSDVWIGDGAHGATVRQNQSDTCAWRYLSDRALDPGTYRILARTRMHTTGPIGTVICDIAGKRLGPVNVNGVKTRIDDLGAAALPNRKTEVGVPSTVHYGVWSNTSAEGGAVMGDYLAYMPTTWGYWRWHPPAATDGSTKLGFGADGTFYVDDHTSPDFRGSQIEALGASKVFVVAEPLDTNLTEGTQDFIFDAYYTPRYSLWG